jgi:hypothetical protein
MYILELEHKNHESKILVGSWIGKFFVSCVHLLYEVEKNDFIVVFTVRIISKVTSSHSC